MLMPPRNEIPYNEEMGEALRDAFRRGSPRSEFPRRPFQNNSDQRLSRNGCHFLNTVNRRRAARLLRIVLSARNASESNPISSKDVLLTFSRLGVKEEDTIEIMSHTNMIPAEYTEGFFLHRRLDSAHNAYFHLSYNACGRG